MATTTWDQKSGMTSATDVDNLESYADQAEASKDAAAASATEAATSAAAALASETASDASETASAASAAAAATSATSAATSATTATTKAAEASTSATNAATSATAAQTAQTAAETAKTAAEAAQTGAETAETNAASSATAAASSASSASTSATSATASQTAAAASATAASASETAATASEAAAGTSETNAAASASTASTAATTATTKAAEASTSATNAATSATSASGSAASAATSATNAAASETAAATSATSAAGSASAASTSATAASASQTAAAASETAAAASEAAAATSATNAATSATTASGAATTATTKASEASASASNAATSEANAAISATSAASSASSAQSSADAALAALDSFDDRYLGQKASDPTLDNDGNALVAGALYFNTTDDVMKVYEGSTWVAAYASLSGALLASNDLSDLNNAATARTNLGLGTAATTASTDYATAAQGALADSALQSSDIGVSVQGYSAVLAGTTASYTTAEETKLAGIEAGATADQTAAEIKTAYESNANTNAFTDAEQTKLAGIESGATADQTASEILTAIKTVDGAASGLDADLLDGQHGSYYLDGNNFINLPAGYTGWTVSDGTNSENVADGNTVTFSGSGSASVSYNTTTNTLTVSATDTNTTYSAGSGIGLSGTTFSVAAGGGLTQDASGLSHSDTSTQASVNNSGATVIQDVTLDTYGHVTGLASKTLTAADVGAITGNQTITLSGDVSGSGTTSIPVTVNDNSHNHSISTITDEHRLFNNMGDNHGTRTDFNATYDFGWRYMQGATNGPNTGASQYYSLYAGLGNEYSSAQYGMQVAYPRNVSTPYISIRYKENTSWGGWQKISAGYADSSGNSDTLDGQHGSYYYSPANPPPAGGGNMIYQSTATISNTASVDFTFNTSSSVKEHYFIWRNINGGTNASLYATFLNGTTPYVASHYSLAIDESSGGYSTNHSSRYYDGILFWRDFGLSDAAAWTMKYSGWMSITEPTSSSIYTAGNFRSGYEQWAAYTPAILDGSFQMNVANSFSGIRFRFITGNLLSGQISYYVRTS